jgi:hypothetical protein
LAPEDSSWFLGILGAEVDDARDGSWRRCFMVWLYLATKPSHVGVDVDGLGCPDERLVPSHPRGRGRSIAGDLVVGEEGSKQKIITLQS